MPSGKDNQSKRKLPWLRLYHRIIDDDKIRLLSFEDRWHFVALLCMKCEGILDDKPSELRSRKIAVKLGLRMAEADEALRRIHEVGLIDKNGNPVRWDDLQFMSDDSSARVKKYREKQAKQAEKNRVKRECDVTVTGQEEDTDTDSEYNPPTQDESDSVSTKYVGGDVLPFGGAA